MSCAHNFNPPDGSSQVVGGMWIGWCGLCGEEVTKGRISSAGSKTVSGSGGAGSGSAKVVKSSCPLVAILIVGTFAAAIYGLAEWML